MNKTITAFLLSLGVAVSAQAEWKFGIGTGLGVFDIDGDLEIDGGETDLEYDVGDIESAFGLNGYAANGPWLIKASGSYLEVEADQDIKGGGTADDLNYERTNLELTVTYTFYEENAWKFGLLGGARYVEQEFSVKSGPSTDDDFIDAVIGATASYMFAENWAWVSTVDASFGDSEGVYGLQTGVNWRFAERWSTSAVFSYESWEYEGDDFESEADEIALSLGIMFHF
ncbi:MAG: outer membrane beta-barrel protein [Coraliomargarita sp.]